METLESQARDQPAIASATAPRPIFIIGAPRSGTSISTWALGQHPNIQPMPETAWIAVTAVGALQAYHVGSERGRYSHLSNIKYPPEPFMRRIGEAVDNIVHDVFNERCNLLYGPDWRERGPIEPSSKQPAPELLLRRHAKDPKHRWIDGTPLNSMFSWGLSQLFPEAKFIHIIRRPHEVVASLANFEEVGGVKHELDAAIQNWLDHTHVAYLAQRAFPPDRVHIALYEDLGGEPRKFYGDILDFLGEPWCDDCLKPLTRKINSSNVENKREEVRAALAEVPLYQTAAQLYDDVINHSPSEQPDEEALAELKAYSIAQSLARRLVG